MKENELARTADGKTDPEAKPPKVLVIGRDENGEWRAGGMEAELQAQGLFDSQYARELTQRLLDALEKAQDAS